MAQLKRLKVAFWAGVKDFRLAVGGQHRGRIATRHDQIKAHRARRKMLPVAIVLIIRKSKRPDPAMFSSSSRVLVMRNASKSRPAGYPPPLTQPDSTAIFAVVQSPQNQHNNHSHASLW